MNIRTSRRKEKHVQQLIGESSENHWQNQILSTEKRKQTPLAPPLLEWEKPAELDGKRTGACHTLYTEEQSAERARQIPVRAAAALSGNRKIPGARTDDRQKAKTPNEDSDRKPTEKLIIDAFRRNDTDRFSRKRKTRRTPR
jgi:hypothetical protein